MIQVYDAVSTVTPSFTPPSGSAFPLGDTAVDGTATDDAGNTGTCHFNVHVSACTGLCGKTVTPRSLYRWACGGCGGGGAPQLLLVCLWSWVRLRRRRARH
jgi:hypothetical protein